MRLKFFLIGCICVLACSAQTQLPIDAIIGANPIDSAETGKLGLTVDAVAFVKDNEYDGVHSNGYTLPGFCIEPRLTWQPTTTVRLEAGFHALVFDGANRYPCYVYNDIGRWKGNQYQSGAHLLPFLRADARIGHATFVLGNIYGGIRHGLMEPLLNPEVELSQDPEMGAQILVNLPHYKMDAWINWQSYIFEMDTHQEAFAVGLSQRFLLNKASSQWHWYVPLDLLVQHYGGEQDLKELGLGFQTLLNYGVGVGLWWNAGGTVLRRMNVEAALLGCWQKDGKLWLYDNGIGGSLSVSAYLNRRLHVFGGIVASHRYVSLYGMPFYSTASLKTEGANFAGVVTPHAGVEWCYDFGESYKLGARADVFIPHTGRVTYMDGSTNDATSNAVFSFGLYFRCHPHWLLSH